MAQIQEMCIGKQDDAPPKFGDSLAQSPSQNCLILDGLVGTHHLHPVGSKAWSSVQEFSEDAEMRRDFEVKII